MLEIRNICAQKPVDSVRPYSPVADKLRDLVAEALETGANPRRIANDLGLQVQEVPHEMLALAGRQAVLLPGWWVECEEDDLEWYPSAQSAQEAAEAYVTEDAGFDPTLFQTVSCFRLGMGRDHRKLAVNIRVGEHRLSVKPR